VAERGPQRTLQDLGEGGRTQAPIAIEVIVTPICTAEM